MKKIVTLFFCLSVFFQLFADDDGNLILAIMEIEDQSGEFHQNTLSSATEYMRGKLKSLNKYSIVISSRQEIATVKIMKENSYKSCYAERCQIKLGRELSADTILTTKLTYFGGIYNIRSEFVDLEKAVTMHSYETDFEKNDEDSLRDAIDDIVAQIAGVKKPKSHKKPKKLIEESPEICQTIRNRTKEYEWENNYDSAISIWKDYIKSYPDGICYAEAKIEVKSLKDREQDWKLRNSNFYGVYDDIDEGVRYDRMLWPMIIGMFPLGAGAMTAGYGSLSDDGKDRRNCIIAGSILLGVGAIMYIPGITYAVYNNYTKGERAAGFLISFGALAAAGGGTMIGLADGNKSLLGGGIATAAVGAGMLAGGIAIAVLDARARDLKGSKPRNTSFFVVPNKDGFYAQLGFDF